MPPLIRGVSFVEALRRFKLIGWLEDGQEGSHRRLVHPNMPGVRLELPDHRHRDLNPRTLGGIVEKAGLTAAEFAALTGNGHRRNAQRIRREVYRMDE